VYDSESKTASRTFTKQDEEEYGVPEGFMTLNVEGGQLVSSKESSKGSCTYNLVVEAGSVLGVEGPGEVDEAAVLAVSIDVPLPHDTSIW